MLQNIYHDFILGIYIDMLRLLFVEASTTRGTTALVYCLINSRLYTDTKIKTFMYLFLCSSSNICSVGENMLINTYAYEIHMNLSFSESTI
jgi:hypothetical protein